MGFNIFQCTHDDSWLTDRAWSHVPMRKPHRAKNRCKHRQELKAISLISPTGSLERRCERTHLVIHGSLDLALLDRSNNKLLHLFEGQADSGQVRLLGREYHSHSKHEQRELLVEGGLMKPFQAHTLEAEVKCLHGPVEHAHESNLASLVILLSDRLVLM